MIDRATENALKVSLTKKIDEWWEQLDSDAQTPLVGNNITEIMATAALAVLLAVADTQDYLYQEDMIKEE